MSHALANMRKKHSNGFNHSNAFNDDLLSRQRQYEDKRAKAIASLGKKALPPSRYFRSRPKETNQFCQPISTKFLDDRRLCQGAKNLLVRLVALAGREDHIDTNKTALAKLMGCSARSIQRYVKELHIFDYIVRKVRISERTNFDIGLKIFILDDVRPVFRRSKDLLDTILQSKGCRNVISSLFTTETEISSIKTILLNKPKLIDKLYKDVDKIPI